MVQQQLDIPLSLAQWRELKPDHVEPEQKILSELIAPDPLFEIAVGGGNDAQLAAIKRFGGAAGLAFQIADDILDVVGDRELLGKDVGGDHARGKATYPAQLGLEESRQRADELCEIAVAALAPLGKPAETLQKLARYIVNRNS